MSNPNPSPENRFKKGQSGNPGGTSKETKQRIDEAKDRSAVIYLEMVTTLQRKVEGMADEDILDLIKSDSLKLLKDVFDRSEGTPKATTEHSGPEGGEIPLSLSIGFRRSTD